MLEKDYIVAGHRFRIVMEEESFIWKKMLPCYGSFEAEKSHDTDCVLRLQLVSDIDPGHQEEVFSNRDNPKPGFIVLTACKCSAGHYFEFKQAYSDRTNGRLLVSSDFRSAKLALLGNENELWLTFNTAVNFCYMLSTTGRDTLLSHSSAVCYKGKAYIFLGKSGTGKSTHSRMWLSALDGVELMNDDHPVLRVGDDGIVTVYGSPWSGKTPCYKNVSSELGGIVRIRQAAENVIRRLSPIESYASLMSSCSGMTWEKELADAKDSTLQKIVSSVPCWVLDCLPETDAALVCSEAVCNNVK